VFSISLQQITLLIKNQEELEGNLITVYDTAGGRLGLWNEFPAVNIQHAPWVIGGDFNTTRFTNEKMGGNPLSFQLLAPFNDVITACSLLDLRSMGSIWSWNNKGANGGRITARLSRILCNSSWQDMLPSSYYEYLPYATSDHPL